MFILQFAARLRSKAAPGTIKRKQSPAHMRSLADAIRGQWVALQQEHAHRAGSDGLTMLAGSVLLLLFRSVMGTEEHRMRDQVFSTVLESLSMIYSAATRSLASQAGATPSAVALAATFRTALAGELLLARARLHGAWMASFGEGPRAATGGIGPSMLDGLPSPYTDEWIARASPEWRRHRAAGSTPAVAVAAFSREDEDDEQDGAEDDAVAAPAGESSDGSEVLMRLTILVLGRIRAARDVGRSLAASEWVSVLQL